MHQSGNVLKQIVVKNQNRPDEDVEMKKEIYITIFLFALMLIALASTVVRGQGLSPASGGWHDKARYDNHFFGTYSNDSN